MFVCALKMSRRQIVTLVFCVVVLIAMIIAAVSGDKATPTGGAASAGGDEPRRVAFLRSLGYTVTPPHTAVTEVLIPDEFDKVTEEYNALQKRAGMDLAPYRGKRVKCWSYDVVDDPSGQATEAHLYEYDGQIIAGDISAKEADGFMRPLIPVERALG